MRAAGHDKRRRSDWRSPGSRARSVRACQGLRPRRVARALAMARPCVLPSADRTASAPGSNFLRGSMAGLHVPLSTLRHAPRDAQRMTRGQHGSLHLCCEGLTPFAPCRSPGAPDPKLSQVFNLPCCIFVQQRKRSDHHGHDWQDPAFAQPEEQVGARDRAHDGAVAQHGCEVAARRGRWPAEVPARRAAEQAHRIPRGAQAGAEGRRPAAQARAPHGQGAVRRDQGRWLRRRLHAA